MQQEMIEILCDDSTGCKEAGNNFRLFNVLCWLWKIYEGARNLLESNISLLAMDAFT